MSLLVAQCSTVNPHAPILLLISLKTVRPLGDAKGFKHRNSTLHASIQYLSITNELYVYNAQFGNLLPLKLDRSLPTWYRTTTQLIRFPILKERGIIGHKRLLRQTLYYDQVVMITLRQTRPRSLDDHYYRTC